MHTTEGKTLDELKEQWRGQERFRYASWDKVPQAEIVPLEGAPHFLLEARPEETADAVGGWLKSLPFE